MSKQRSVIKLGNKASIAAVEALKPEPKRYDVRTDLKGLLIVVQPSGIKSYVAQWARGKRGVIGHHPVMTPAAAYTQGLDKLRAGPPIAGKSRSKIVTLRDYLDKEFEPWATEHQRWGARATARIKGVFADHVDKPLDSLNAWVIEKWRSKRIKAGVADATLNRDLATLRSALSKAVEWHIIKANPLAGVKQRKVDNARVRFLSADEERRLRDALALRDFDAIAARKSGNTWRRERGKEEAPAIPLHGYADHLSPMVLLALDTGLRRGELTALVWEDIDIPNRILTVRAAAAKSNKSRKIPLNREAVLVLERWKRQQGGAGRLFAVHSIKTAWATLMTAAKIDGFRFHDTRHNFASRLVSHGVDLNTVRELLGHADLKMTLRYAHLAQEHKAKAVEMLGRR